MSRIIPVAVILLALALGAGCTGSRSVGIEGMLEMTNVTGTWQSVEGIAVRMVLEQSVTKVSGRMFVQPSVFSAGADIEGSVAGEVFRFSMKGANLVGEMQVSADDMSGYVRGSVFLSRTALRLQRVISPGSQQ